MTGKKIDPMDPSIGALPGWGAWLTANELAALSEGGNAIPADVPLLVHRLVDEIETRRISENQHVNGPTVYAHVERTVHALLDAITKSLPVAISPSDEGVTPDGIKLLAEAVQALSSWPQFNPMNAREQYKQLAEYEVKRAIEEHGIRISGGATEAERTDVGSAFEMAFSKIATLADRVEKLEGTF